MTPPVIASTLQLDCDGRILTWPSAAQDMFGYSADRIVGRPFAALVDPRQRGACDNVVEHLCRDTRPGAVHTIEVVAERADATTFDAECSLWHPDGTDQAGAGRIEAIVRDVSGRVRVEEALRQELRDLRQVAISRIDELRRSQQRFVDITETIDEVFWIADPAITRMLYISPGYQRVWGRTCASLYENPRSFIDAIHPDDRERFARELGVKQHGQPFDHEYRILLPDGTVRWIWDRGFPVRDREGTIERYIGVAQDITMRKAAEAALRRRDTLDAMGQMTGGLAHDFNNVLGVIVGHLDLATLALPAASPARESVDLALDAALRGSRLAKRLLALARREPADRRVIRIADAVEQLTPLLQHAAGGTTELAVHANANLPVSVDPGELDAALINLAVNARAAMPNGGRLTISIDPLQLAENAAAYSLEPGAYVQISVADTGCGMPEQVLRRLGEPFFTTRPEGEGTGLGVSMIHAFVRQSGGALQVESERGGGSCFRLILPVATGAPEPAAEALGLLPGFAPQTPA